MIVTFEVQGKTHAEIEKAAIDRFAAYADNGKFDCHIRYEISPLVSNYGDANPSLWIAKVEIHAEPLKA